MNKQNVVHPDGGILFSPEKERSPDPRDMEEPQNTMPSERSQMQKTTYCMKCPAKANPQRQEVDWWVPGKGGRLGEGDGGGECLLNGVESPSGARKKFWN